MGEYTVIPFALDRHVRGAASHEVRPPAAYNGRAFGRSAMLGLSWQGVGGDVCGVCVVGCGGERRFQKRFALHICTPPALEHAFYYFWHNL